MNKELITMRIPPASVLCRKPTVDDVRRWPHYFTIGPGRFVASRTPCGHGYMLTDSCPYCDADADVSDADRVELLDQSSPDEVTDVIAVYRKPNSTHEWEIWVNGAFQAATQSPGNLVMQAVSRLGGQVVVRYEDDDSLDKRAERRNTAVASAVDPKPAYWYGAKPSDTQAGQA